MVAVHTARLRRPEAVLLDPGVAEPLSPRGWAADLTRVTADGTSVDLVDLGPHRYTSTAAARPSLLLVAVASGRVQGVAGEQAFEVQPGQALLVDTRRALRSRVDRPVRLLRTLVAQERLPAPLLDRPPLPMAVLDDGAVLRSCLAATSSLLQQDAAAPPAAADDEDAVAQLLTGLQIALVAEARRQRIRAPGLGLEQRRFAEISLWIDDHLADPDLGPASIARTFSISLRTLHSAFDGSGTTAAALIRQRRVDLVQELLRSRTVLPRLAEIAALAGFDEVSRLGRSFRTVTGQTPGEWFAAQRAASTGGPSTAGPTDGGRSGSTAS